jgi:hypothetical protein
MIIEVEKCYGLGGFCSYRMKKNNEDIFVPLDEANTDYQAIQEWIAEGNTVIDNPPQENN